jgi:hypothetical protein
MTEYIARVAMSCGGKIYKPGDTVKYTDWPPEHREAAWARRVANGDVLLPEAYATWVEEQARASMRGDDALQ